MPLSAKYNKDVSATPKHHRNPQLTPAAHPHPFQNRYCKTAWNSFENRRVAFRSRTSGNNDLPTSTCRPRPGHPSGSPPVTHLQLQRRPLRRPVAPGPHPGGRRPGRAEALPPGGRRRAGYPSAASWLRQERAGSRVSPAAAGRAPPVSHPHPPARPPTPLAAGSGSSGERLPPPPRERPGGTGFPTTQGSGET